MKSFNSLSLRTCFGINSHSRRTMTTSFKVLDDVLNGFYNSSLVIIAGRPTMRADSLIYKMIGNWILSKNFNILLFTTQNKYSDLEDHLLTRLCGITAVDSLRFWQREVTNEVYKRYSRVVEELGNDASELFIEIPYETMASFTNMHSRSLQVGRKNSIHTIVIDGYHFIDYDKGDNIRNMAKHLKELAVRLDIPVIVNVPLPSKEGMPQPKLSDLGRYETEIDWDIYSDVILGVNAADRDNSAFEHQDIKVEVLKNNYGKEGDSIELEYDKTRRIVYSHEQEYARPSKEMTQEEIDALPF